MEILEGICFALLWASATVATKLGLRSADPFVLSCLRFLSVGVLLNLYVYGVRAGKYRLPDKKQFRQLFLLGLLNVTLYIGAFVIAVRMVSAGLISLFTATNPLMITFLSALWLKRKIQPREWIGMLLSFAGLAVAAFPNLQHSHATLAGILILIAGILAMSVGSIYYANTGLTLHRVVVNTWQTSIGGLLFIPVVLFNYKHAFVIPDTNFYLSLGWLVLPVSVVSYGLWLHLLQRDTVKAGMWLFITPVLGYLMAALVLHEKITLYAVTGTVLVISGLWYAKKQ
jgi:drug/metabolite transporter (DMT)-like permease